MSRKERTKKSLCGKSMKLMVNIIRLSSFSIAKMSIGASGTPGANKNRASGASFAKDPLPSMAPSPGGKRSQEPWSSSKPKSFVMQPDAGNDSSYVIHDEKSFIDGKASEYIRKVHEKNRNLVEETSILAACIPPPPPKTVK